MNHEGSCAGVDDGDRPNFRYVAWLLLEKLNDLVDGDQGKPSELEMRSLLNLVASRKIISVDPKMLNPVLWRTLPQELLLLVLARLPVPDITRLRCLSKEWNRDMSTVNSDINRALDETSPTMFAVFSRHHSFRMEKIVFYVTIWTERSQYSYRLNPGDPGYCEDEWHDMGARDGGLVCFVSTWKPSKAKPMCIVVVNLLTRVRRKLPRRQYVYLTPPEMMHIKVDSETKCYRVVVVGKNIKGRPTVEIYDSGARQWTIATRPLDFVFGPKCHWEYNVHMRNFRSPYIKSRLYDFAEGQLKYLDLIGPRVGASVMEYELHKDCMFVLHRNSSNYGEIVPAEGYRITKYRVQSNAKDWVQERSYLCCPLEALVEKEVRSISLKACEGFLMVFPSFSDNARHFWLLDLSSGEWSSLPNCFDEEGLKRGTFMTRASWNVFP